MPRNVDPDQRRQLLANAVWRVARRDGLDRASVRAVAAEAGLAMGSLRHYFTSQSELHAFAMRLIMESIRSRIEALDLSGDPDRDAEAVLEQLLPLDEQRRAESEVWLAFTARSLVDPTLRALRDEAYDLLHDVCRQLVENLLAAEGPTGTAMSLEVERLYALLDGLLLHGVIRPRRADPDMLRATLAGHLAALVNGPTTR